MKAARYGHLHVLQWVKSQDPSCEWSEKDGWEAAKGGHINLLEWMRSLDPPLPLTAETCKWAAQFGQLSALEWLRNQDPKCPWNQEACIVAAWNGKLSILQWLRREGCPWKGAYCYSRNGITKEVIDWAKQQARSTTPKTRIETNFPFLKVNKSKYYH